MAIRRYEVTSPEARALRTTIGEIIGGVATRNLVDVTIREYGVDIPRADGPADLSFSVMAVRQNRAGLTVQGQTPDGNTVNLQVSQQEMPNLSLVTPE